MALLRALYCAAALGCLGTQTAAADGYFLQSDVGEETQSVVGTMARGSLNYGFNLTNYEGGHSGSVSATYTLPLGTVAVMKVGPTIGYEYEQDDDSDDLALGLKLSLERYTPTSFGSTYFLADASSVHRSWFLLGQVTFTPGNVGLELSRGGSDTYHETTFTVQKRLSDGPVSLRVGYKLSSDEIFAGFSINTF